jgi:ribosome-associated protein
LACEAARDKKAVDVLALDMRPLLAIVDYFVIAGGTSTVHTRAIAEEIADRLAAAGIRPARREGMGSGRWVLLDYGGVVVHVFHEEERDYYNLERYWQAAERPDFARAGAP